jgi:hypothetical protein
MKKNEFFWNNGVRVDYVREQVLVRDQNLLPSLFVSSDSGDCELRYQGPEGFGSQSFVFDIRFFERCFEGAKFKRFVPKDDYQSFEVQFFNLRYERCSDYVRNVFKFFGISPSIIEKARSLSGNKRLRLRPKSSVILKSELGISKKRGPGRKNGSTSSVLPEPEVGSDWARHLDIFVRKAASTYDLSCFRGYLEVYKRFLVVSGRKAYLSQKQQDNLFNSFVKKVDFLQNQC